MKFRSVDGNKRSIGLPVACGKCLKSIEHQQGTQAKELWTRIPDDTDILVTLGPPAGHLDDGMECVQLRNTLWQVKPTLYIFRHIHQAQGILKVQYDGVWTEYERKLRMKTEQIKVLIGERNRRLEEAVRAEKYIIRSQRVQLKVPRYSSKQCWGIANN